MVKVRNVSKRSAGKRFVVVHRPKPDVPGIWYYDAWNDFEKAFAQALEIDGLVIPMSEVDVESWGWI